MNMKQQHAIDQAREDVKLKEIRRMSKPILNLYVENGIVKCKYAVYREIDGIVYVVHREDKLAIGLLQDASGDGWDPEKWKDDARKDVESSEKVLADIPHEDWDTKVGDRVLDTLSEDVENLQRLENEYPEGVLEQAPWKSGKIRLSRGNPETEKEMTVEELKRGS